MHGTVADALSNLGGFDAWWDEQRQGAARRHPEFAFEYLPATQLSLTAQAAQSDPVRGGPLQFVSAAPPPFVEYAAPPPALLKATAVAMPAAAPAQSARQPPTARQMQGAAADAHTGARLPKPPPPARPILPAKGVGTTPPEAAARTRGRPGWDHGVDRVGGMFETAMMERAERARVRDGPPADFTEARLRGVRAPRPPTPFPLPPRA